MPASRSPADRIDKRTSSLAVEGTRDASSRIVKLGVAKVTLTVDSRPAAAHHGGPQHGTRQEAGLPRTRTRQGSTLGRLVRRGVWLVLGLIAAWVAAVLMLTLLYTVVPPVSTLMIGRWLTLRGVERTAVTLEDVSPYLPRAVISSEDGRFCQHGGVDWDALRQVIEEADEDGPSRGASTIPMQLAKNLFLWPSRSYLRKGMEIPLAILIDLAWSKRRLIENYLNIVELGEGVFGAEAAAQRYFGKRARDLSAREAALLAAALPNPTLRNPGRPSARHRALAVRLQRRMEFAAASTACLRAATSPAGASQHAARPV